MTVNVSYILHFFQRQLIYGAWGGVFLLVKMAAGRFRRSREDVVTAADGSCWQTQKPQNLFLGFNCQFWHG